ncbi:glycosyltransferase [Paenibacillus sp. HN-1]|uniref:glycosyltransferase n=1 Tax=Paenibacillus TaxID=44249 RepID=UPI001CAA0914|nr:MULTISPECIES: glycosyltransferase [Paenibacillus]MBY9078663.1 glycosyltransferase [Paenibacillus sp. CGMCC 1.18879]MBY9084199.1 glycosyltransferase [Paenibacillus sinensis]
MYERNALRFNGEEWIKFERSCKISNTFTYEFWVKADEDQIMDEERNTGADGIGGRSYLIGPDFYPEGAAGCGVSVGTNGISVYEHSVNHLPARMVFAYDFSDWQHVAIVCEEKKLRLYINGLGVKGESLATNAERLVPSLCLGGHEHYGTFKGQVREFRLWSTARSELDICGSMFIGLSGDEAGLYFYRDPERGVSVTGGVKRYLDVSVILPSFNKCPLNYFSLLSLERQHFPMERMEVVFLDDASTDHTPTVYFSLLPEYSFIYVRQLRNRGRSVIRNIGASIAAGYTLLFADAEMIGGPDWVMNHVRHHQQGERKIVSGAMLARHVYTMTDPNYSPEQIADMAEIYAGHPTAAPIIDEFLQGNQTPVQLLPLEWMFDPGHLNQWSSQNDYFQPILDTYGYRFKLFHYAWLNLITSNVSIRKTFFDELGGFEEDFMGFGWEDWELGYRAAKSGALFIHDDSLTNYHQDHPISNLNMLDSRSNYLLFCQKYPRDMEIRLLALTMMPDWITLSELNEYLTEYNNIRAIYKNRFPTLDQYLNGAFNLLLDRLGQQETVKLPIAPSVLGEGAEAALHEEIAVIERLEAFPNLLKLVERIHRYFH